MTIRDRNTGVQGEFIGKVCKAYDQYYIVKTSGDLKIWINTKNAEVLRGNVWEMI